jgi:dTDP-4-dehydrorhamnose reductase
VDAVRILLLGKNGQIGWELQRTLASLGRVSALDTPAIDLTDEQATRALIRKARPQVIVNAAAYTAVDRAESEAELAYAVNAAAVGVLAEEALKLDAALIHYSTDYVFDGRKTTPYSENDPPNPINVYGKSKLSGEQAIQQAGGAFLILRTSWVYSLRKDSFVSKVLAWAQQPGPMRVVTDQVSCPTWCRMLAEVTAQLLAMGGKDPDGWLRERKGLYHLAGSGRASRFEWARAILRRDPNPEKQKFTEILPALTADFLTAAKRPLFSVLDCSRFSATFGLRLPAWEDALALALKGDNVWERSDD